MSDFTFSKRFILIILIIVMVAAIVGCTIGYYLGHHDGEDKGYRDGVSAAKGILLDPESGKIYEGVVVGIDYSTYKYVHLQEGMKGGGGELYLFKKGGFVLINPRP